MLICNDSHLQLEAPTVCFASFNIRKFRAIPPRSIQVLRYTARLWKSSIIDHHLSTSKRLGCWAFVQWTSEELLLTAVRLGHLKSIKSNPPTVSTSLDTISNSISKVCHHFWSVKCRPLNRTDHLKPSSREACGSERTWWPWAVWS